ncbi:23 kDa integral membrane protein [Drosophila tropicalis]|uniref:23 kDa integral membrane protein n=1 Tax=Drosophila tropicalis TaxID=46794 RepID=UPI0035ABE490
MSATSCLKFFIYIFYIICALLAFVDIGFGSYVLLSYDSNQIGTIAAYAYVAIGAAALVLILWGFLSAWRENVCCTITFIVFFLLVIIAQVGALYFLINSSKSVASNFANALETTWEEELDSPGAMSLYENWFHCCGRGSPNDYIVNERMPPATCFRNHDASKAENLINNGCRVEFENYWLNLIQIFNILSGVLVSLELVLIFFSCRLCTTIRNERRRQYF